MATFQLSYKAKGDAAAQYCGGVRNTMRVATSKEKKNVWKCSFKVGGVNLFSIHG